MVGIARITTRNAIMMAITIVYNWTISLLACSFAIRFTLFGMN